MSENQTGKPAFYVAEDEEQVPILSGEMSRPPSYGALSSGPPTAFSYGDDGERSERHLKPVPKTVIPRSTLACLLLQHISR